jgi:Arc/MetJ-type ribon-helix-helix transcriptional regulator
MTIEVTNEVVSLMRGIYANGQYASEAEVLSVALQLLQKRDQLRADLQRGCDELDRGERVPGDEVFAELRMRARELDERGA